MHFVHLSCNLLYYKTSTQQATFFYGHSALPATLVFLHYVFFLREMFNLGELAYCRELIAPVLLRRD